MEIESLRKFTAPVNVVPAQKQEKTADTAPAQVAEKTADKTANKAAEVDLKLIKTTGEKKRREEEEASAKMLHSAIDTANTRLKNANRLLQASVHEKTHRIMVKVIDSETDEVVREIPPEKTLDLFAKVLEMAGILLDEKK